MKKIMDIVNRDATLWFFVLLMVFVFFAVVFDAAAADHPHTLKSYQVSEDADNYYYSDNLSDGSEKKRVVAKPKPKEFPVSITLIGTNDLPVLIEYVYVDLYASGRVVTNHIRRAKTERERAVIRLPDMMLPEPTEPDKTDALGQAAKRARMEKLKAEKLAQAEMKPKPEIEKKQMERPDRVTRRWIDNGEIVNLYESGIETREPLRRMYTARVKSAPADNDPKGIIQGNHEPPGWFTGGKKGN